MRYGWLILGLVVAAWPGTAMADWYYRWSCAGACAPDDLAISGMEGPYASEEQCNSARDADSYHRELVLQSGNAGLFESCQGSDDGSTSSGGSSYGSGGGGGKVSGPPELRFFAGTRWPAWDDSIRTGKTMAGQTPDMINRGGRVDPGLQLIGKIDFPRWSGGYLELTYFRNGMSSMDVPLGTVQGGAFGGGYQRGKRIGTSRCGVQWNLGVAFRVASWSASEENTELSDEGLTSMHVLADSRLTTTCRLTEGGTWLDLGAGVYYSPMKLKSSSYTNDDPDLFIETSSTGLIAGLGLTFQL